MILVGIDCQIPSNKIHNEDIVELVKYYSSGYYNGSIEELESIVRRYLKLVGSETRFWRLHKEKPLDLIIRSIENALKMASITKNDIDLVIYSSIDRGFIEPSNAAIICKAIGLNNVRNFDIVDACMGWASSVQVTKSFLLSNPEIQNVLIINSEFPIDTDLTIFPANFQISKKDDLSWKAASFTLGESASATIFQASIKSNLCHEYIENSNFSDLCVIPLPNYKNYIIDSNESLPWSEMQFFADSTLLLKYGMQPALDVLNKLLSKLTYTPNIIFPHSVSGKIIQNASDYANLTNTQLYSTYKSLGNLATVSIPSGITKALHNNVINKGDKVIAWLASAGMKFSAFEIQL